MPRVIMPPTFQRRMVSIIFTKNRHPEVQPRSQALVLRVTNAGVRRPGNEATCSVLLVRKEAKLCEA